MKEVTLSITQKCDEIKKHVNDIIKASNEDFLNLEVTNGAFYLSQIIDDIETLYKDKLDLLKINFVVNKYCCRGISKICERKTFITGFKLVKNRD